MSDHATLAEALVAAQADMPAVERDATNPHFKSSFTSLGHLLAKARPVLNKHGLSIVQLPSLSQDGRPTLRTTILHTSGESIEADAPLLLPKNDPQGQGSAITYMRRYSLASALGISDQEDDDGNAGTAGMQTIPKDRAVKLYKQTEAIEMDFDALRLAFGAVGAMAPREDTPKSRGAAFLALTTKQADEFEESLDEAYSGE